MIEEEKRKISEQKIIEIEHHMDIELTKRKIEIETAKDKEFLEKLEHTQNLYKEKESILKDRFQIEIDNRERNNKILQYEYDQIILLLSQKEKKIEQCNDTLDQFNNEIKVISNNI